MWSGRVCSVTPIRLSPGIKDSNSAVDVAMAWLMGRETRAWFTCWDLATHLGCRCTSHSSSNACVSIQRTQDGTPCFLTLCPHAQGGASSPGGQVAENYSWKLPRRRISDLEPWRAEENLQEKHRPPCCCQTWIKYACNASNRCVSELSWKPFPLEIPLCPLTVHLGLCCPLPNVMLQVSFLQFRQITFYSLKIQWISSSVCSLEYIWSLTWCVPLVFFR